MLDFLMKYGIIFFNGLFIIILMSLKWFMKKPEVTQEKNNLLLVIAHPDDEAMQRNFILHSKYLRFFVPAIKELKYEHNLYMLCLSNGNNLQTYQITVGNFDGIGKIREKELEKSGKYFGFMKSEVVFHKELQDGMQEKWPKEIIEEIVIEKIEEWNIKGIITFDEHGISGHPNHIATAVGCQSVKAKLKDKIKLFELSTVNLVRKFLGIIDLPLSIFNSDRIFLNYNIFTNIKAMRNHYSQFVWFRKLFVFFSRYTFINTLNEVKIQ